MDTYKRSIILTLIVIGVLIYATPGVEAVNKYRLEYRVKNGDTLWSVSQRYGVEYDLVAAMNGLAPDAALYSGQRIYLPRDPEMSYTIQPGDTLWDIANKYRTNADMLLSYNNIDRPERIQIGQEIKIPINNPEETPRVVAVAAVSKEKSRGANLFSWPLLGVITSNYGPRKSGYHHGLDIAESTGTPIKAAKSGKVIFSGWRSVYGYAVIIDHGNDTQTLYGHASKLLVKKGQYVYKGQIIAKVGNTGRTTGPHLHFEVRVNGKTVNPKRYLER